MTNGADDRPLQESLFLTLAALISDPASIPTSTHYRDEWDSLRALVLREKADVSRIVAMIKGAMTRHLDDRGLREISRLVRDLAPALSWLDEETLRVWLDLMLDLVSRCPTDHRWRLNNGAEWLHEGINTVCGDSVSAAVLPIILSGRSGDRCSTEFLEALAPKLDISIDASTASHAETIIASLAQFSTWISKIDPDWLRRYLLPDRENPELQKSLAFWQGFLPQRKWDLEFLRTAELTTRILELFSFLNEDSLPYKDYFGKEGANAFVFLLAELFFKTPKEEQLVDFFKVFLGTESNSSLLRDWFEAIGFAINKIDGDEYPGLADEIFTFRFEPLIAPLLTAGIQPMSVGAMVGCIVGFRENFLLAFEMASNFIEKFGCVFSGNSRLLLWLDYGTSGSYHVRNSPKEVCKLIVLFVKNSLGDKDFSDWQLRSIFSKYAAELTVNAPFEWSTLLEALAEHRYINSLEIISASDLEINAG